MSLRGRVGRHTREHGRQCQNWPDDQKTVMDLLNSIAVADGGAGKKLVVGRIVSGVCGDALYGAIQQFENKNFPHQGTGFVDPDGAMLKLMERLAAGPAPKPETALDKLRRNVLSGVEQLSHLRGWTPADVQELAKLASMAVAQIDRLKQGVDQLKDGVGLTRSEPLDKLPWWAELFGRAYVMKAGAEVTGTWTPSYPSVSIKKPYMYAIDRAGQKHKVSAEMKYGSPLSWTDAITTSTLPALILFQDGLSCPVPSGVTVEVAVAHEDLMHGGGGQIYRY